MDKCREEFEKQRYWVGLFRTGVDFDVTLGEFGRYISNGTKSTDAMDLESFNEKWEAWANCWQHQQAKVEELQEEFAEDERFLKEQIKDKDQRISNLEYQQGMDKELIQSLQSKSEKLQKQVTDLDNRATQYALDEMATAKLNGELQKRVDLVKRELKAAKEGHYGFNHEGADIDGFIFDIEQALKGEG